MKMSRKGEAPATLEDIARRLKVSRVTVSKALRGHPDISEETAAMVRKIAEELGYRPNIIARALSTRRSGMIGLVVPKIAHSFFGAVIEGVYNTAFASGYEIILTVSQENAEREKRHLQTLVSMRVDGIIVSVSEQTRDVEVFQWIRKLGIPLMFLDREPEPPLGKCWSVLVDDKGGAYKAVDHAAKLGYRNIACFGGNPHINIGKNRYLGFEAAMKAHRLPVRRHWVIEGGFGKDVGYNGLMQLHKEGKLPELIFAVTYPVALGVFEAAKQLGLRIPEDVDVICFGDSDVGRIISPALSCVSQPSTELGTRAVEVMLSMITHPNMVAQERVVLPTSIILRETCTGKNVIAPLPTDRAPQGALART